MHAEPRHHATPNAQPKLGVVYYVLDKHAPEGEAWIATYTYERLLYYALYTAQLCTVHRVLFGMYFVHRSDAFYCFHNVNAFEEGDDLVIDLLAYDDMSILYQVELSVLRDNPTARGAEAPPHLRRYAWETAPTVGN